MYIRYVKKCLSILSLARLYRRMVLFIITRFVNGHIRKFRIIYQRSTIKFRIRLIITRKRGNIHRGCASKPSIKSPHLRNHLTICVDVVGIKKVSCNCEDRRKRKLLPRRREEERIFAYICYRCDEPKEEEEEDFEAEGRRGALEVVRRRPILQGENTSKRKAPPARLTMLPFHCERAKYKCACSTDAPELAEEKKRSRTHAYGAANFLRCRNGGDYDTRLCFFRCRCLHGNRSDARYSRESCNFSLFFFLSTARGTASKTTQFSTLVLNVLIC